MSHWVRFARLATIAVVVFLAWNAFSAEPLDRAPEAEAALDVTLLDRQPPGALPSADPPLQRTGASFRGAPPRPEVLLAQARLAPSPTAVPPTATPVPPASAPTPSTRDLGLFRITGYSDSPFLNGTDGRGITRSGERTHWGAVAVDPDVIPLGTRLRIEGMGETVFRALDTGGGIRGRWVDVWFHTDWDAIQHGVRQLKVYELTD